MSGNETPGYSGDGGPVAAAEIEGLWGVTVDPLGDLFFGDIINNRVREVVPAGVMPVTITPAPLTVAADTYSVPYGAPLPTLAGTLTGVANGDAITASYNCSATTGSDAGSYTITPTLIDPNDRLGNYTVTLNAGTLTITHVAPSVGVSAAAGSYGSAPYGGVSGTVAGVNSVSLGTPSFLYYIGANVTTSTTAPLQSPPINAGTYTVLASYAGGRDYAGASNVATFTIGQATATVTLPTPPANLVADGSHDVTSWVVATVTGVGGAPAPTGGVSYTYYTGNSATGTPLSSAPIAPGTYTVVAGYGGNSNYAAAQSNAVSFTIQRRQVRCTSAPSRSTTAVRSAR